MCKTMLFIVLGMFFFSASVGAQEALNAEGYPGDFEIGNISQVSREPSFMVFPVYADQMEATEEGRENPAIDLDEITNLFSYIYRVIHVPPTLPVYPLGPTGSKSRARRPARQGIDADDDTCYVDIVRPHGSLKGGGDR